MAFSCGSWRRQAEQTRETLADENDENSEENHFHVKEFYPRNPQSPVLLIDFHPPIMRNLVWAVEVTVQNRLKALQDAVDLSPDRASFTEFQAAFELYRSVIAPGSSQNLQTTGDLVEAIKAFWLIYRIRVMTSGMR